MILIRMKGAKKYFRGIFLGEQEYTGKPEEAMQFDTISEAELYARQNLFGKHIVVRETKQ